MADRTKHFLRPCESCGGDPTLDLNGPWVVYCDCGDEGECPSGTAVALTREAVVRQWNERQRANAIEAGKCVTCTYYPATTTRDMCAGCHAEWQEYDEPTLRAEDDPRRTVYGVPAPKGDEP